MDSVARNQRAGRVAAGVRVTTSKWPDATNKFALPMSLFLNRVTTSRDSVRGSVALADNAIARSVKVVLSARRSMHIAMLTRRVQAIFNNVGGCP
jgi:hypothetical protein